jgi:hypothetical protein
MGEPLIGQVRLTISRCQSAVYMVQTWATSTWSGSRRGGLLEATRLPRPQSITAFFTEEGKRLQLKSVLPPRVGRALGNARVSWGKSASSYAVTSASRTARDC